MIQEWVVLGIIALIVTVNLIDLGRKDKKRGRG